MTERSPIFNFVAARVQFLQTMVGNSSMAKGTPSHSRYSAQTADALIVQLKNGTALGPKEAVDVIQAIRTQDVFTDHDRERIIDCIGIRVDLDVEETTPSTPCTAIMGWGGVRSHPKKQTMEHLSLIHI